MPEKDILPKTIEDPLIEKPAIPPTDHIVQPQGRERWNPFNLIPKPARKFLTGALATGVILGGALAADHYINEQKAQAQASYRTFLPIAAREEAPLLEYPIQEVYNYETPSFVRPEFVTDERELGFFDSEGHCTIANLIYPHINNLDTRVFHQYATRWEPRRCKMFMVTAMIPENQFPTNRTASRSTQSNLLIPAVTSPNGIYRVNFRQNQQTTTFDHIYEIESKIVTKYDKDTTQTIWSENTAEIFYNDNNGAVDYCHGRVTRKGPFEAYFEGWNIKRFDWKVEYDNIGSCTTTGFIIEERPAGLPIFNNNCKPIEFRHMPIWIRALPKTGDIPGTSRAFDANVEIIVDLDKCLTPFRVEKTAKRKTN